MTNIAIENGTFIVDLPIKDGDFPVRKLLVYQRVMAGGTPIHFLAMAHLRPYVDVEPLLRQVF